MTKFFQCSYCKISLRSEKEHKDHEEVCVKNKKTYKERFEARITRNQNLGK